MRIFLSPLKVQGVKNEGRLCSRVMENFSKSREGSSGEKGGEGTFGCAEVMAVK